MENLKGVVIKEYTEKDEKVLSLSTDDGIQTVKLRSKLELNNVKKLSLVNVKKQSSFLKSYYDFTEDSFALFYPGFLVQPEEIAFDTFTTLISIFNGVMPKESFEGELFYAIRGMKESARFDNLKEIFPKDINAKFSFYPYIYDTTYGFFIKDALFFGKYPVILENNFIKGAVLALVSKQENYLILNTTGTFNENKVPLKDKKDIIKRRNDFAFAVYHFYEFLSKNLEDDNPNIETFKFLLSSKEKIGKHIESFFKDFKSVRKSIRKLLETDYNNLPLLKLYNTESENFSIKASIKDNEFNVKKGTPFILVERYPLKVRTFGVVNEINYTTLQGTVDFKVISGEGLTPIKERKDEVKGIVKLAQARSRLKDFLLNNAALEPLDEAINDNPLALISSNPCYAVIKGSFGTGKKHIIKEFIEQNPDKKVLVFSKEFYKSLYKNFGNLTLNKIEDIDTHYDDIFYFVRYIEESIILNLSAFTDNLIIFTYEGTVPFENNMAKDHITILNNAIGLNKYIHRFVSKIYPLNTTPNSNEDEIKIINKDNVDKGFIPLINPEKFVQFVGVSGKTDFEKNKINRNEAQFTVELASQFIKGGVERSSIGVISPYERHKAFLIDLLRSNGIEDVAVNELDEAIQKPITIINFVDETLPPCFKDRFNLTYAITRGQSKVILVGTPLILKKEQFLS
ncbi:MAG: hypothetical protein KBI30_02505 [Candidatus Atribacteria bacterium]|nr:hypothetical protein [Candidatus Atribacteria bacterium]